MPLFSRVDLTAVGPALEANDVDGWLLFDFHGINPIVKRVVGYSGMASRRLFVWLPKDGSPVALAHRIELQGMEGFPGEVKPYAAWQELHQLLGEIVNGKKIAMEVSPDDAVPYLDRVPAGVVELVQRLGGTVVPSATLVSLFAARWSSAELAAHRASAEKLADIARTTIAEVVGQVGRVREAAVQRRVLQAMEGVGLVTDHPPIVAFGPNAANPHYEPYDGADAELKDGDVVLVDLWGGPTLESVFADQTWMGFAGVSPPDDVLHAWTVTRDARDAVLTYLERAVAEGRSVTGADLDDVARGHITKEGFGDAFLHRTGHSIDTDLHGSGPHLDNFETNDVREVLPGTGFSVEPGIYLEGRFGIRSEINVYLDDTGPHPTPVERQQDLITKT